MSLTMETVTTIRTMTTSTTINIIIKIIITSMTIIHCTMYAMRKE